MVRFPQGFLWGAATSAYQVEGNNVNADWWPWEKEAGKENSGQACRHYEFYEQDFDLAQSLDHNAHRLSIEWSRIEPQEGKFSHEALRHYIEVIVALRKRRIEPIVTLHHFTNPLWFAKMGGWTDRKSIGCFLRYCDFMARSLAPHVRYWITLNEPTVYLSHAYVFGAWPPQERSYLRAWDVADNLVAAHIKAYGLIHKIYEELNFPKPSVSVAQYTQAFVPCTQALRDRFACRIRDKWFNFWVLDRIFRRSALDFIGLNYYSRQLVELDKWGVTNVLMDVCKNNHHPVKKNSLGWDIYPEGLYEMLLKCKKYNLPVIITENGICTDDDDQRWEYIHSHLKEIARAMEAGVRVSGYLYWSLIDNFEWDKGFRPKFGLIDVDYSTYKRTVRQSAKKFALVCKSGVL